MKHSKFINVLTELWCKPWVIMPDIHRRLCDILDAHISGTAHDPDGIVSQFVQAEPDKGNPNKIEIVDGVAVIPVHGVIGHGYSTMLNSSGVMSVDVLGSLITEAVEDERVNGILLDVNSPGGTVTGVPETAELISNATASKPVVAFTDSLMASAAMWLASGANAIYATQSASVGSIGVYMAWLDESRAMEMQGYRTELIKRGKFKAAGIKGLELTEEQREDLQSTVDKVYGWFVDAVIRGRGDVNEDVMEGQCFFGADAVDVNLADAVGTADKAMEEMQDLIKARA